MRSARRFLRACFKIVGGRRVRARGLLEMAKITKPCRPGPLTGRFLKQALSFRLLAAAGILLFAEPVLPQDAPITLDVDATDAPRKILHARLRIPAQPGKLTLVYPKWIPGEHGPNGPITDLVGLRMSAAGRPVEWQRDPEDMYAFHLEVPAGANAVEISLDFLFPPNSGAFSSGASPTAQLVG